MQKSSEEFDGLGIVVQRLNHKLAYGCPADRVVPDRQSSDGTVRYRQSAYCDISKCEAPDRKESQTQATQCEASNGEPTNRNEAAREPSNRDQAGCDVSYRDDATCVSARLVVA